MQFIHLKNIVHSVILTAAERTRERDEAAQIKRLMSEWEFTERGTCGS